ncbi:hypothetical protein J2854_004685 [Agrobacterium tumefaciens]|nr:hypothetical protein [Agrobacterium tumefaciens]
MTARFQSSTRPDAWRRSTVGVVIAGTVVAAIDLTKGTGK